MKKYDFRPYSTIFPKLFEEEKKRIAAQLTMALAIEHVGSTAVPELGGKGIIDICIAVTKGDMQTACDLLQGLGYEYRPAYSVPDRLYFVIHLPDPEEGTRRYHVHLTYPESNVWKELLEFRDFLRQNSKEREEYSEMKRKASIEAMDEGEKYRKIKGPMFEKVRGLIGKVDIEFRRISEVAEADLLVLMNNPQVVQHMPLAKKTFEEADYQNFISDKQKHWDEHGFGPWAFYVEGVFAGWGGLQLEGEDIEIALVLHPKFWGYGKEIYKRIVKEAFEERGFKSIIVLFPPSRSRVKGLGRLGFKKDGELMIQGQKFLRYRLSV